MIKFLPNSKVSIILVLVLLNVSAFAQPGADSANIGYRSSCQSVWTKYNNLTEKNSIVRSNNLYRVVYVLEKETGYVTNRHTFIVKRVDLSSEVAFSTFFYTPLSPNVAGGSVVITDMRLYGDTCYFCGKVKYLLNEYIGGEFVPKTNGLLGWFSIPGMLNGSGSVYFHEFDTVTQLARLAISKPDASTLLVSAIGTQRPNLFPCIVEVKKINNVWENNWHIDCVNNESGMFFSDIMTLRDSITLLAQYDCANDNLPGTNGYDNNHQVFLLDRYDLGGCYNMYHSVWSSTMVRYTMNPSEDYYFHYDKAPMRLFHINDLNNEFGVAFGVEKADGNSGGIRLFAFQNAWQYYSSLYYQTGLHAEIKEIGNKFKTDSLYVLTTDNTHTNGLIAALSLGVPYDVTWLTDNSYTYNSLTQKFAGDHVDVSGHDGSYGFRLFDQDVLNLSLNSCFYKEIREYEVLPEHLGVRYDVKWEFGVIKKTGWITAEISHPQITTTTECKECD